MYLQKLSLMNFKNFDSKTFEFEEKIIVLLVRMVLAKQIF